MARHDRPIRVLIADDSALVRDLLQEVCASDPQLCVAGVAVDGADAVAKAAALEPDIITMDIEMPVLGGLEAIERIMAHRPTPILVVTSQTGVRPAFAAVSKGALEVIEKPDLDMVSGGHLARKLKLLARVDLGALRASAVRKAASSPVSAQAPGTTPYAGRPQPPAAAGERKRVVAIAASTGGPKALMHILSRIPADFPAPIVICQHVADGFAPGLAEWLGSGGALAVSVARSGDMLRPGRAYLNPSGSLMRITAQECVALRDEPPGQTYHPSCDAMLASVAAAFGAASLGLILSGMGDDGVAGMKGIRAAGGATLAQDEASSVIFGMNGLAVRSGCIDKVLPLSEIPAELLRRVCQGAA